MKILTTFFSIILLFSSLMLKAQVDPSQTTIVVDGGSQNIGLLEFIINNDVDENGDRINPNRIYMLKKDEVYIQQSQIQFNDPEATLNIVGEEGGNMPIVLMQPLEGAAAFQNVIFGNLSIKNIYWPTTNLDGNSTTLFSFQGPNVRIEAEDLIVENIFGGTVFSLNAVQGTADIYIKNSYFRDVSQLSNSWNRTVLNRGDYGEAIDTLWIENTTVSNGGMPFFGKLNSTNFFYFNHNTIVNSTKYPIWMERFREAYIANNLFINANWEGECRATWETQVGEDWIPASQIRFDTIEADFWISSPDVAPAQEDVKILASNNLNFFSPLLDPYYNGAYNEVGNKPISNRTWGSVTENDIPILVENVKMPLLGERELALVNDWEGIKQDNNHDYVDPQMVTKGIRDAAAAAQFAMFARNNYSVASAGEDWDRTQIWFGDGDPLTIPGGGNEEGGGLPDISGLPEDFSYTNGEIYSLIDGRPLGSLAWWPGHMNQWDSEAALEDLKQYHVDGIPTDKINVGIFKQNIGSENAIEFYPNPANDILNIVGKSELNNANLYDITGKLIMTINLNGALSKELNVSELDKGIYLLQVSSFKGETNSLKFVKE